MLPPGPGSTLGGWAGAGTVPLVQHVSLKGFSPLQGALCPVPLGPSAHKGVGGLRAPAAGWGWQPERGLGGPAALAGWLLPQACPGGAFGGTAWIFLRSCCCFFSFSLSRWHIILPSSLNFLIHKTETKTVLVKGVTGPWEPAKALKSSRSKYCGSASPLGLCDVGWVAIGQPQGSGEGGWDAGGLCGFPGRALPGLRPVPGDG